MLPVEKNLPAIELTVFNSGWVRANQKLVVAGAPGKKIRMPALFAMIRHPQRGIILYDTGYNTRFYEATRKFPYRLLRWLTPAEITAEDNADRQLAKAGVAAGEVRTIILGHGHVDHVPGIIHFPQARVIVDQMEWKTMQGPALQLFRHAYLKSLYQGLPNPIELVDFGAQGRSYGPFPRALDLEDDGSLILVPLPGHTAGQMGLLVNLANGRRFFFIGDAAWVSDNYLLPAPPAFLARMILASKSDYLATLNLIHLFHQENPEVTIVPSHCPATWEKLHINI